MWRSGTDLCFLISPDLCDRRRDVHSGGHHRLLHIHCLGGLEEDPDREDVMRITDPPLLPSPQHIFIYKCKVASPLAKSSSAPNNFLVEIL